MSAATAGSVPSGTAIAAAAGTTDASAIVAIAQYDRTPRNGGLAIEQGVPVRRGVGAGPWVPAPARPAHPARDEPRQRNELADPWRRRRPGRRPRRRRRPRGPWRSASAGPSRRRGRAGRSGTRPRPASGPGPRRPVARAGPARATTTGAPDRLEDRGPDRGGRHGSDLRVVAALDGPGRPIRDVVRPPHRAIDRRLGVERSAIGRRGQPGRHGLAGDRDGDPRARLSRRSPRRAGTGRRPRGARR